MIYDFAKLFSRDSIKLNFLREILAGQIKLELTLDETSAQDYSAEIHSAQSRVKVYGNFNLSEDPSGEVLTIRVVTVNAPLIISLSIPEELELSEKNISLFRSLTKSVETSYALKCRTKKIEFISDDMRSYSVKIHEASAEPSQLQNELNELKSQIEADEEIIKYYNEDDTQAIQKIFSDIKPKLSEAEKKIKLLIEAREAQSIKIENAAK